MDLFAYAKIKEDINTESHAKIINEDFILNLLRSGQIECNGRFHCRTESYILQLAYDYNKILSLSNSRTRILAHQVESTHRIVNAINHRFLIADEVGLGKTIEAGLVIKELIYRHDYKRVLIACPASLLYQWQSEMKSKFNERFEIMDRRLMGKAGRAHKNGNPWKAYNKIICSLDFMKNADFADDLASVKWDVVVFDEAHRLRRDAKTSTLVYNMAENLSKRTKALLLLSATPFRGKLEELYFLISLLDKNILGPFHSFFRDYCVDGSDILTLREKLSEVLIRRTKREIGGFTSRQAKTVKFDLYSDERLLYDETTKYVVEEFNRAIQTENRAIGFVMTIFQKLLDSSSFALYTALVKRRQRLMNMVEQAELGKPMPNEAMMQDCECDESFEEEFSTEQIDKTIEELKLEIKTLSRLIEIAENIQTNKKGEKLLELITSLKKKSCKKFLIFTQFRTTQDYLAKLLSEHKTIVFNGSMSGEEKENAILDFKNNAEILIATEAGGEGRNMQFCNILINYDLPWSPLKIEQRIGRVHRFGQAKDVFIYNFSTAETVAERVLEVLTHKLKLFEDSIGAPDIMLGEIEDELNLDSLFMGFVAGNKKKKEIDAEIERQIFAARENYEKLSDLTVSGRMDFNYDEYYKITMKERQFSNRRIERFINMLKDEDEYCASFISEKHSVNKLYHVKQLEVGGKTKYGTFDSQAALDNDNLEFLAFGHPVIDNLMEYSKSVDFGGYTGIKTVNFAKQCICLLCNYVVTFKSVHETKEFVTVAVPCTGSVDSYDLEELESISAETPAASTINNNSKKQIEEFLPNIDSFAVLAKERLELKIARRISAMSDDLDFNIDPQLAKIRDSYDRTIKELEEKLELHQSRMKWYGNDLKSVITKVSNQIAKAKQEKENRLETYKGYLGIEYNVEMISAGFLISGKKA